MTYASVQVPVEDREALMELATDADLGDVEIMAAHPFDGSLMLQVLVPISTAAALVLRKWIDARQKTRQAYRVFVDGIELTGYTLDEVERLLQTKLASQASGSADGEEKGA